MTTLAQKIAAALADEDTSYAYLTGAEFISLTKSRRVAHFNLTCAVDRFTEVDGSEYFHGLGGALKLTKPQAVQVAEDFAQRDWHSEEGQLYAKVYVSQWRDGRLYVAV